MRGVLTLGGLVLTLASIITACGGANGSAQSSKNGFNPPAPTPGTPNPADQIKSLDDAILKATDALVGKTSERITVSGVQSLMYVEINAAKAYALVTNGSSIDPVLADRTAWLFVERGDFQDLGGTMRATPGPVMHTVLVLAIEGYSQLTVVPTGREVTLGSLGTPVVIPRGRIPQLDAIRKADAPGAPESAPTITVGTPTLVAGKVRVPVSTTGTGLAAYTGFNVHLRWDQAVFSFSSANSTGTVIAGALCPAAVPDADGAGVTFACTSVGGAGTTAPGLLATIVLTPTGAGCSPLHLFTYGGADGGNASTGTYTIDATTHTPQPLTTIDARVGQSGAPC